MTTQFFDPRHMTQIAEFYSGLQGLIKKCGLDPLGTRGGDLYVNDVTITIRHADDWAFGRFKMEDGLIIFKMEEGP